MAETTMGAPSRSRTARKRVLGIATSALLALGGAVAVPVAAHAAEAEVVSGELTWGVKDTWRNYVTGGIAKGSVLAEAPATVAGSIVTWANGSGTVDTEAGTGTISYEGTMISRGHEGPSYPGGFGLNQTLVDPQIELTSTTTATLSAEVTQAEYTVFPSYEGERVDLAALTFDAADLLDGEVAATGVFTEPGAAVYGNYAPNYVAGTYVDDVRFGFTVANPDPEPEVTTTTLDASATTVNVGDEVVLTATVDPADAAGDVQFLNGENELGDVVEVEDGEAVLKTDELPAGEHSITASFLPADEGAFATSTSSAVVVNVSEAPTFSPELSVEPAVDLDPAGETVTVTGEGYNPDQAIYVFLCEDIELPTNLWDHALGCRTGSIVVYPQSETNPDRLKFDADGSFEVEYEVKQLNDGATSVFTAANHTAMSDRTQDAKATLAFAAPASEAVETTTTLDASATEIAEGESVDLSATVDPAEAAGSVQFKNGDENLGAAQDVEDGEAELTTDELPAGENSITAVFTPADAEAFTASTSNVITVTVEGEEAPVANPELTVTPSEDLDPSEEHVLNITGTGYVGEGAANGAYVLFGEKSVWSGNGPLPTDGWVSLTWVPAAQFTDGEFSTTLTVPANELDPALEYHVATSAAHGLALTDRSLDAFHDVTVAQPDEGSDPETPVVKINGSEGGSVQQGDDVDFSVSPVDEGTEFGVTIHSDPVDLEDLAVADENGVATAAWTVPADFETGEHTVVFADTASDTAYEGTFTVTAADSSGGDDEQGSDEQGSDEQGSDEQGDGTDSADSAESGGLAQTGLGSEMSLMLIAGAVMLLTAAGLMLAGRREKALS